MSALLEPLNAVRYPRDAVAGDRVLADFEIMVPDGSMLPCIAPMTNSTASSRSCRCSRSNGA